MNTLERKEWIARRRKAHHAALSSLTGGKIDGLTLWRKLRRIEGPARQLNEDYCNGTYNLEQWATLKDGFLLATQKAFGGELPKGVFINGDPRGHALKLDCDIVSVPMGMERDWGGNGILAAEIDED